MEKENTILRDALWKASLRAELAQIDWIKRRILFFFLLFVCDTTFLSGI